MTGKTLPRVIRLVLEGNRARNLFWSVDEEIRVIVQRTLDIMAKEFRLDIEASVVSIRANF